MRRLEPWTATLQSHRRHHATKVAGLSLTPQENHTRASTFSWSGERVSYYMKEGATWQDSTLHCPIPPAAEYEPYLRLTDFFRYVLDSTPHCHISPAIPTLMRLILRLLQVSSEHHNTESRISCSAKLTSDLETSSGKLWIIAVPYAPLHFGSQQKWTLFIFGQSTQHAQLPCRFILLMSFWNYLNFIVVIVINIFAPQRVTNRISVGFICLCFFIRQHFLLLSKPRGLSKRLPSIWGIIAQKTG